MGEYTQHSSQIKQILKEVDAETGKNIIKLLSMVTGEIKLSYDILNNPASELSINNKIQYIDKLPINPVVACQGVEGAYSHIAAKKIFEDPNINFLPGFKDVTAAVAEGRAEFGILPIENSTAGEVDNVIEYTCQSGCYITAVQPVKVNHCLAGTSGSSFLDIKEVYSHPQALMQTVKYAEKNGIKQMEAANTAVAAKLVAQWQDKSKACVCSELSANIYGLDILEKNIQDIDENYTRFICIHKSALILPNADTMAIALSFPNQTGSLSKFLTLFSLFDLDLTKIESMPIGGSDFNVRFHLDFKGSITDKKVANLLGHMYNFYDDFQFLGNYKIL